MKHLFLQQKLKLNNQNKTKLLTGCLLFASFWANAQQQPTDSIKVNQLDAVLVQAVRASDKIPMAFNNLDKKDIAPRNLGQDIPILLNYLPSVVTTSDAGNGVGYTGIRVRGSDATRVNVTINGIPYNDAEGQGTYWVNLPDFASSVQSVQLQRGVGTSTNGAAAFGASLNLLTDTFSENGSGEIANSIGSFNTFKHTVKFSSGLIDDHLELAGRLSVLKSDGYVDRATSDLKSYFLQSTYLNKNSLIKALVFGGQEITYQSWNGVDAQTLANYRTFNSVGMKFSDTGDFEGFYNNQVDHYNQDHAQLHWNQKYSPNWSSNLAFHYTKGKGYYEEYVDDWYYTNILFSDDSQFSFLGLNNINVNGEEKTSTDYVRRKWLDNDFYGTTFSINYNKNKIDALIGGGYNQYEGKHFDEIIWAAYASNSQLGTIYDMSASKKTDGNIFGKVQWQLSRKLNLYGDLQVRKVSYKTESTETGLVDVNFNFFNPKAGINFDLNKNQSLYVSYAKAHREPNRTDYQNGSPKPEKLDDIELGFKHKSNLMTLNLNAYYMKYKDQLVLTGSLDDVGNPLRANSGDSYRLGLEFEAAVKVLSNLIIAPNFTLSSNKNQDFYFSRNGVLSNLGNTNIAYSPNFIFGNNISYVPISKLNISLLTKIVSEQYMGNIDSEASKLPAYFVNDINISYELNCKKIFKSIVFSALINNIFNYKYESNGYFYTFDDDYSVPNTVTTYEGAGYYPQAGINFLAGINLRF
jgi:iron complex outermembrane recepter protein